MEIIALYDGWVLLLGEEREAAVKDLPDFLKGIPLYKHTGASKLYFQMYMKYDTDWNWIMSAYRKILAECKRAKTKAPESITSALYASDLTAMFNSVAAWVKTREPK